jgi:pimeloyl-ACP methyl ester carboxylesterase
VSRARTAGLLGALVGVAAAGVAGGIAAHRVVTKRRSVAAAGDPYVDEPFDQLPFDRELTVSTDDGVDLHVEVVEPAGGGEPDLTVVLVHGFALDMGTFHFQRRYLSELTEPKLRLIAYDQPGHGRSGRLAAGDYTIDALGDALRTVIEEVAPAGPLVLVGHSMGGMAIMALADQHPELFVERVRAVALISSSAGKLSEEGFGLPKVLARARQRLLPVVAGAARLTPAMIDRARGASTEIAYVLTRRFGFAGDHPSPALVAYVERMNSRTSMEVIAGYLSTLFEHTRYAALAALGTTDVLVVCGDSDFFTPLAHSEEICRLLPNAELVVVPAAGHMALLEYPDQVDEPLRKLVERAARSR